MDEFSAEIDGFMLHSSFRATTNIYAFVWLTGDCDTSWPINKINVQMGMLPCIGLELVPALEVQMSCCKKLPLKIPDWSLHSHDAFTEHYLHTRHVALPKFPTYLSICGPIPLILSDALPRLYTIRNGSQLLPLVYTLDRQMKDDFTRVDRSCQRRTLLKFPHTLEVMVEFPITIPVCKKPTAFSLIFSVNWFVWIRYSST